ncbi:MAG TPA: P-loop NTPase fold protein, partial [Anaerolineales bacterium]|nr:P-loop NTPase fold protein [Anaerolineales bacterium]
MTNDRWTMWANEFGLDRALSMKDALERDRLHRIGFARQIATALVPLSVKSSIVVSVEGAWGSGKTSVLSMVEALLGSEIDAESRPIIVPFNPWLIGNRDALLREFLKQLSRKIELSDHSETAKKVAREIDGYSKLIGLAKFIPGAEPIATITKAVLDALGKAAAHAAEEDQGIEQKKARVEEALTKLSRKVIVLVDDIDRLYPNEVFEIIRIIKAVADLPNVGYVLAFDPVYASEALKTLGVPNASAYLDKVIQTRLSIPTLSANSKLELINVGFNQLPEDAKHEFFPNSNALLAEAYHYGLRDLLDQPRDFARLFNVVARLEP